MAYEDEEETGGLGAVAPRDEDYGFDASSDAMSVFTEASRKEFETAKNNLVTLYDTARQNLEAQREPAMSDRERRLRRASVWLTPTKTGKFYEKAGMLGSFAADQEKTKRESEEAKAARLRELEFGKQKDLASLAERYGIKNVDVAGRLAVEQAKPKAQWQDIDRDGMKGQFNIVTGEFKPYPGSADKWRPETRGGREGQVNTLTGEFKPYPGKDEGSGVLPATLQKAEDADIEALGLASAITADVGALRNQLSTGQLNLSLLGNLAGGVQNRLGISTEGSRRLSSFKSTLEKMRNDSLRLNSGVQTEGDAQRAWNELFTGIADEKLVAERLAEIEAINARAAKLRAAKINQRRKTQGYPPIDLGEFVSVPSALPGGAPDRSGAAKAELERRKGGKPGATGAPAAAPPPNQRKPGAVYDTPQGPMKWTGTGWVGAK